MRTAGARVYREIPFVLAIEPGELAQGTEAAGLEDRPLVRGIIDGLIVEDGRVTIVDFKTDRVSREALARRASEYKWQMDMYARAVENILTMDAVRKVLYFLSLRELVQM